MADYKLTVHKDTEHGKDDPDVETKVQATIVVSFPNPAYVEPEEDGITDVPETLEFSQEIFVPTGDKEQKKAAQDYADAYEKDFVAQEK